MQFQGIVVQSEEHVARSSQAVDYVAIASQVGRACAIDNADTHDLDQSSVRDGAQYNQLLVDKGPGLV